MPAKQRRHAQHIPPLRGVRGVLLAIARYPEAHLKNVLRLCGNLQTFKNTPLAPLKGGIVEWTLLNFTTFTFTPFI